MHSELTACILTNLEDPRSVRRERVSGVNNVPVPGEAAQQVPHALGQRAHNRMNKNLGHQVLRRELYQPLA